MEIAIYTDSPYRDEVQRIFGECGVRHERYEKMDETYGRFQVRSISKERLRKVSQEIVSRCGTGVADIEVYERGSLIEQMDVEEVS